MCPEGLERRRKSSSPRDGRLSIQPSWKWDDLGPKLQHSVRAGVCSALALFAPGLHGMLSSLQLSICKSHERLIIWFSLMCILSLQSLFIKNNFLVEIEDSFNILKQQRLRSHGELLFRLIKKLVETLKLKRLLKHSNKIVFYYVSGAEFNIKNKYSTGYLGLCLPKVLPFLSAPLKSKIQPPLALMCSRP